MGVTPFKDAIDRSAAAEVAVCYDWDQESAYDVGTFLELLDEVADRWFYGDHHRLGQRFVDGDLDPDELSFLAVQEHRYYLETTWWNAGKLLNAGSLGEQRRLHAALLDELGTDLVRPDGLPAHADLFLRYCVEGLGLTEEEVRGAPSVPGVLTALSELRRISSQRPTIEMLVASNLVIERQRPRYYRRLLDTFATKYRWVPTPALQFYEVHATHDIDHESVGRTIVRAHVVRKPEQDIAMAAALRSVSLRWVMYDAIEAAMAGQTPFVIPPWPGAPGDPWPKPIEC